MNSPAKGQQSFSSYSRQENQPHPSQDQKFSEYEQQQSQNNNSHDKNEQKQQRNNNQSINNNSRVKGSSKLQNQSHFPIKQTHEKQKRRYSSGRIQQKQYNYLANLSNDSYPPHPKYSLTSSIKSQNPFTLNYMNSKNSPKTGLGVGMIDTSSGLIEYQKCYLSGLSKYYKGSVGQKTRGQSIGNVTINGNKRGKIQNERALSSSFNVQHINDVDKSQYWNGEKFQYLTSVVSGLNKTSQGKRISTGKLSNKQSHPLNENIQKYQTSVSSNNAFERLKQLAQIERNTASGLIVNRREAIRPSKVNKRVDSSTYIKIEEDVSNSKNNYSGKKNQTKLQHVQNMATFGKKYQNFNFNIDENSTVHHYKSQVQSGIPDSAVNEARLTNYPNNNESLQQNKHKNNFGTNNLIKIQNIDARKRQNITQNHKIYQKSLQDHQSKCQQFRQKTELLQSNNRLTSQLHSLKNLLSCKQTQIHHLSLQRLSDNQKYSQNIEKLKSLFEQQRKTLLQEFQEEINVYKSVRKQAIRGELKKQEEQKVLLIVQKNKIQNILKKTCKQLQDVNHELQDIKDQLRIKTTQHQSKLQESNKLQIQNQHLSNQLSSSNNEIQVLQRQLQGIEKILKDKDHLLNQYNISLNQYSRQLQSQQSVMKEQQNKINMLENSLLQNQSLLVQNQNLLLQKDKQFQQLIQKNKELFDRIQKLEHNSSVTQVTHEKRKKTSNQHNQPLIEHVFGSKDQSQQKKHSSQIPQGLPQWIRHFLQVFENMTRKICIKINPDWSSRQVIFVGWKTVKLLVQRAVKQGLHIPEIQVNQPKSKTMKLTGKINWNSLHIIAEQGKNRDKSLNKSHDSQHQYLQSKENSGIKANIKVR